MVKLKLYPNDEGLNGYGMYVRYNRRWFKLNIRPKQNMGCKVYGLPMEMNTGYPHQSFILLYEDELQSKIIGRANFDREIE